MQSFVYFDVSLEREYDSTFAIDGPSLLRHATGRDLCRHRQRRVQ